jgi:lipid-A-disaccharide synthase-like uncharacterized protein
MNFSKTFWFIMGFMAGTLFGGVLLARFFASIKDIPLI